MVLLARRVLGQRLLEGRAVALGGVVISDAADVADLSASGGGSQQAAQQHGSCTARRHVECRPAIGAFGSQMARCRCHKHAELASGRGRNQPSSR